MKAIQLELRNKQWATFFLNNSFSLHERKREAGDGKYQSIAVLEEGTHGNGGWELADSYDEVNERLLRLFDVTEVGHGLFV